MVYVQGSAYKKCNDNTNETRQFVGGREKGGKGRREAKVKVLLSLNRVSKALRSELKTGTKRGSGERR